MTVKQFLGHIAVIIEVAYIGGGQTQQFCTWAESQQPLRALTPKFRTNSMKLIQYNVGGVLFCYLVKLLRCTAHQLGIRIKSYILKWEVLVLPQ